ncbi:hypothetical protein [Rheinheimera maricola]|uniref:Type III secretion system chaperone YscW n=1 Tax=Rheinheimera maricola TaxID=2793282 RepID=A0ABS7X6Z9_9GAMM|nr:hypothetical protein [Rheinheimera maricola]MBZ9610940.1 hypothetical protein [Rheinheimera maricola]
MRLIYCLLMFACGLSGCQPIDTAPGTPLILLQDSQLQLQLIPEHAPVETLLQLQLISSELASVTGELNGVTMYMGRVPLRFSRQGKLWQADFLLGACSDPEMQWQVQLELEFINGKKRSIKQQFRSSWR